MNSLQTTPRAEPSRRLRARRALQLVRTLLEHGETKPDDPDDRFYYRTTDGWECPIWHHRARPGTSAEPIVLAHGWAANARAFDYPKDRSLARMLSQAGFDVFVLEHRGDPHAVPPRGVHPFDFDDIVAQDLPAALEAVRLRTGFPRALVLGHSLGGLMWYAYAARGGQHELAGIVTLGSPTRFEAARTQRRIAGWIQSMLPPGLELPLHELERWLLPVAGTAHAEPLALGTDGSTLKAYLSGGTAPIHGGMIRQVAGWVAKGSWTDRHDQIDPVEALRDVHLPCLGVVAGGDRICPPWAATPAFEALAGCQVLELDQSWNHLDLLLDPRAPEDVRRPIAHWLDDHRRRCWSERAA